MRNVTLLPLLSMGIVGVLLFGACTSLKTASYDQYSYQKAIEMKVRTIQMLEKAVNPYEEHALEMNDLLGEMEKMIVYEQNRPNNEMSYKMWQLMANEDKNFVAGFIKRWEEKGQFSPVFVEEVKSQILEAMDIIIRFEGKKDIHAENDMKNLILKNQ